MRPSYLLFLAVIFLCQQGIRAPLPLGLHQTVDHVYPLDQLESPYKYYDHDLFNVDVPKAPEAAPVVPVDYAYLAKKGSNVVFSKNVEDQETVKTSDQMMTEEEFKKKFLEYYTSKVQELKQFEGHEY